MGRKKNKKNVFNNFEEVVKPIMWVPWTQGYRTKTLQERIFKKKRQRKDIENIRAFF